MTTKQLSDVEKARIILKESRETFEEMNKRFREMETAFRDAQNSFECAERLLKRALNEEANGGNIHKDCEWYHQEKDYCSNYVMGYPGLAFEVSRHKKCILEMLEND